MGWCRNPCRSSEWLPHRVDPVGQVWKTAGQCTCPCQAQVLAMHQCNWAHAVDAAHPPCRVLVAGLYRADPATTVPLPASASGAALFHLPSSRTSTVVT